MSKKNVRLIICAAVIFCTVLTALPSLAAGGINTDYLDPDKWYRNERAQCAVIDDEAPREYLCGKLYYTTDDNMCLYSYIVLDDNSTVTNLSDARVIWHISTATEEYTVVADENGINTDETGETAQRLFDVRTDFSRAQHSKWCSAIKYLGKEPYCYAEICVFFKTLHRLESDILIVHSEEPTARSTSKSGGSSSNKSSKIRSSRSPEKETTAKKSGAKKSAASSSKGSIGSQSYGSAAKSKSDAKSTTKFVPSYAKSNKKSKAKGGEETEQIQETVPEAIADATEAATVMSGGAKAVIGVGLSLLIFGIILIIIYLLSSKFKLVRREDDGKTKDTEE